MRSVIHLQKRTGIGDRPAAVPASAMISAHPAVRVGDVVAEGQDGAERQHVHEEEDRGHRILKPKQPGLRPAVARGDEDGERDEAEGQEEAEPVHELADVRPQVALLHGSTGGGGGRAGVAGAPSPDPGCRPCRLS